MSLAIKLCICLLCTSQWSFGGLPCHTPASFSSKPKAALEWPGRSAKCLCRNVPKISKFQKLDILHTSEICYHLYESSVMKMRTPKFSVLNEKDHKVDYYEICETEGSYGSDHLES